MLELKDRNVVEAEHISHTQISNECDGTIVCDGEIEREDESANISFSSSGDVFQFRLNLKSPSSHTGIGARLRLRNWDEIKYVAIGYTANGEFRHIKSKNPPQGIWFDFYSNQDDLAWLWSNAWSDQRPGEISDIRLYIKGLHSSSAYLDIQELVLWSEESPFTGNFLPEPSSPSHALMNVVLTYQKNCFQEYESSALQFLEVGNCPLYGRQMLDWSFSASTPKLLEVNNTYKFSWHSIHPSIVLMLHYKKTGEIRSIIAARSFIEQWLEKNYFTNTNDVKYAWYDHGTAERCLALICMHYFGRELKFDTRFMHRLVESIFRHAQLLSSDAFYASHQKYRYHNHAWFQDIALLVSALYFSDWPCASYWTKLALSRLNEQFDQLIVRDNGFAVFVENSIGYHHGIQRIVEFAAELSLLSNLPSDLDRISYELGQFSSFFRYPNGRSPSQGDTFRLPPNYNQQKEAARPYSRPSFSLLKEAGYAIVKGNSKNRSYMLCFFATSLSETHKHCDNLNFTLFFDGVEWIIDPSFYSHQYKEDIPKYLRSQLAHNTVFIENNDYSIKPHTAFLDGYLDSGSFKISGHHDAYSSATICRDVFGSIYEMDLRFIDRIEVHDSMDLKYCLLLHFGEDVDVQIENNHIYLTHPFSEFRIVVEFDTGRPIDLRHRATSQHIHSICGHGFLEKVDVCTVAVELPDSELRWRIFCESRSDFL